MSDEVAAVRDSRKPVNPYPKSPVNPINTIGNLRELFDEIREQQSRAQTAASGSEDSESEEDSPLIRTIRVNRNRASCNPTVSMKDGASQSMIRQHECGLDQHDTEPWIRQRLTRPSQQPERDLDANRNQTQHNSFELISQRRNLNLKDFEAEVNSEPATRLQKKGSESSNLSSLSRKEKIAMLKRLLEEEEDLLDIMAKYETRVQRARTIQKQHIRT